MVQETQVAYAEKVDVDFVRRALEQADSNSLRVALYQATGDRELLEYQREVQVLRKGAAERTVIADGDRQKLIEKALEFLLEQAGSFREQVPTDAELKHLLEVFTGNEVTDAYVESQRALTGFDEAPYFAKEWKGTGKLPTGFSVGIIGSGFSGISAGAQFAMLGIPFTIYERRSEVGGVWSINRYPAVRVDTMSASYQLGFMRNYPWKDHFAAGADVRKHIDDAATAFGVHRHIKFEHDITSMRWNAEQRHWELEGEHNGQPISAQHTIIVSATGLFATPRMPDFAGLDDYEGDILHTTEWPEGYPLEGKTVAVIGNGSTGVQLVPTVAEQAKRLSVFVRTPQWVSPREYYGEPIDEAHRWLVRTMPYYWNWERVTWSYANMGALVANIFFYDREWQAKGGAISEHNDKLREALTEYIKEQTDHRPELYERLIPKDPPWARRMIVDGGWYKTLTKDHVALVTSPIDHLEARAIVTEDGERHPADVIISASGFSVNKYMYPIDVYGRDGRTLEEWWESDGQGPRAFKSMSVPNFPNLFIMYGPNSQGGAPFPANMEVWARYIADVIFEMAEHGYSEVEVKYDVYDDHNQALDARTKNMIFAEAGEKNYYISHGRVSVMAAWGQEEYWQGMTNPELAKNFNVQ